MIITNRLNLPLPLVRAIEEDPYTKGDADYSVSEIINPVQLTVLYKRHKMKIVQDASEFIWILLGKAVHKYLEIMNDSESIITEKRLFLEMDGVKISGQFDLMGNRKISDYKCVGSFSVKEGVKLEWEIQQNLYRYLAVKNGFDVDDLEIVAILRDWTEWSGRKDGFDSPIFVMPVAKWEISSIEKYLKGRIAELKRANAMSDEEISLHYPCSEEERWFNPKTNVYKRCKSFCPVRNFCQQVVKESYIKSSLL